jgi:hypothetical protein
MLSTTFSVLSIAFVDAEKVHGFIVANSMHQDFNGLA